MPDNKSAVPVSQRARELLAESCDKHGFSEQALTIREGTWRDGDGARCCLDAIEAALSDSPTDVEALRAENARLREALEQPWSWPCPEGGAHCCCDCDDCCDCDRPRSIMPDWQNAETCIENVLECYATDSASDADGPVDTVVNSGDLFVILSLAGAAFRARAGAAFRARAALNDATDQEAE